jgi:hypothetical protein
MDRIGTEWKHRTSQDILTGYAHCKGFTAHRLISPECKLLISEQHERRGRYYMFGK